MLVKNTNIWSFNSHSSHWRGLFPSWTVEIWVLRPRSDLYFELQSLHWTYSLSSWTNLMSWDTCFAWKSCSTKITLKWLFSFIFVNSFVLCQVPFTSKSVITNTTLHWCGFSLSCTSDLCLRRSQFFWVVNTHSLHWKDLFPSWTIEIVVRQWTPSMCCFNFLFSVNLPLHTSHSNDLFSLWTKFTCFFKLLLNDALALISIISFSCLFW